MPWPWVTQSPNIIFACFLRITIKMAQKNSRINKMNLRVIFLGRIDFGYKKCLFHDLTICLDNLFLNQKIKDLYDKKPFRRFVFRILNI